MHKIIILAYFRKQLKPLVKKYPSLKEVTIEVLEKFDYKRHPYLGNDLYKLRLSIKEIKKGKSRSFRLIVLIIKKDDILVPVTIYFKGDTENLSPKELNKHLELVLLELMDRKD